MNIFSLFSGKKHDEFAIGLADEFVKHCPLNHIKNPVNRKAGNKFYKTINRIYAQAHDYTCGKKLSIYTKARIGNKFMWCLKEAGYDDGLIEELTNGILHALQNKK